MSQLLKKWILWVVVLLVSPTIAGCGQASVADTPTAVGAVEEQAVATEEPAAQPSAESNLTLTVFAAASLSDAFSEIGRRFEEANPDVTVVFNFAGSNQLAAQIGEGAPADVFASANATQMDAAIESARIDAGSPQIFATNRLVVVYPANNPAGIVTLQDLARPGTLLVLAAAEVPVGRYALEFLDKAAAEPDYGAGFKDAVLRNVVSYEENVRSVLNKVALGEADVGIVYTSDLFGIEGVAQLEIPDALNIVAEYPIAAINDSVHHDLAWTFVDYVMDAEGQDILAEYGFGAVVAL